MFLETKTDRLFNRLVDSMFNNEPMWKNEIVTYYPSKLTVEVKDDTLEFAYSVLGHDPKNVQIDCYEDRIHIKAHKDENDQSVVGKLTANIDEALKLGKDFDGTKAKAEIKNGILFITVEKKESQKPKQLQIRF